MVMIIASIKKMKGTALEVSNHAYSAVLCLNHLFMAYSKFFIIIILLYIDHSHLIQIY